MADVIIVLGYVVFPSGDLSIVGKRRVELACHLYLRGVAPLLLFTGGRCSWMVNPPPKSEAETMENYAGDVLGISRSMMFVERTSTTTRENAVNCKRFLDLHDYKSIIIVTSGDHLSRAVDTFQDVLGMEYTVQGVNADDSDTGRMVRELE